MTINRHVYIVALTIGVKDTLFIRKFKQFSKQFIIVNNVS